MSTAESPGSFGFEVVVSEDGSIPAEILAKYGFRPGSHLRLLPGSGEAKPPRKKLKGALVGKIDVEAFEAGMAWGEADRICAGNRRRQAVKVVADSHIILWYLGDPTKLSQAATAALDEADETDGIGVSIASLPDVWYSTQKNGPDRVDVAYYEELKATLTDPERNAHILSITERSMPHLDAFPRSALRVRRALSAHFR